MIPDLEVTDGPARIWRLVQKRASLRLRGDDPDILPLPEEDKDIESFYSVMTDRSISQEIVELSFPDHYRAMKWYLSTSPSSIRWAMEAWLLAKDSLDDVLPMVGMDGWRLSADIYRRAFFNITPEQRSSQTWMNAHVWVPSSMHQNSLYYFDYLLKLAAMTSPNLVTSLLSPSALTNEALRWLRNTIEDQRDRIVVLSGNSTVRAPIDLKMASYENTMKAWREDRASEGLAAQDSAALQELMQVVGDKVSILDHDEKLADIQTFAVEKYSDSEVKKPAEKTESQQP